MAITAPTCRLRHFEPCDEAAGHVHEHLVVGRVACRFAFNQGRIVAHLASEVALYLELVDSVVRDEHVGEVNAAVDLLPVVLLLTLVAKIESVEALGRLRFVPASLIPFLRLCNDGKEGESVAEHMLKPPNLSEIPYPVDHDALGRIS